MDLLYFISATNEYENLATMRDMSQAYHTVTANEPPSQQLLDFINHDRTLVNKDGLALEFLSADEQHMGLQEQFNTEHFSNLALEKLLARIYKVSKFIAAAPGPIGLAGKVATIAINAGSEASYSHDQFLELLDEARRVEKIDANVLIDIPKDFNVEDWREFAAKFKNVHMKQFNKGHYIFFAPKKIKTYSKVKDSITLDHGWNQGHLDQARKGVKELEVKVAAHAKDYATIVSNIADYLKNKPGIESQQDRQNFNIISDCISRTIGTDVVMLSTTKHYIGELNQIISYVASLEGFH